MTLQLHITWEALAEPGLYTGRTHDGDTPTLTYAEIQGPYTNRADAEAAQRRALKLRPNAQTEIITTPARQP